MDATRVVVTGVDTCERSVIARESRVEPSIVDSMPGFGFCSLWGWDGTVTVPNDGARPEAATFFPPNPGVRWDLVVFPSGDLRAPAEIDIEAAMVESESKMPDAARWMEPDEPGMHATETIELVVILDGEIELELDDANTAHLRAGDCVVQNGTRHAWRVPFDRPCTGMVVLVGAERAA